MAKPKLCEIIAVVSGKKGEVQKKVTEHYHLFQKGELFDGLSRTYQPRTDDGEMLPPENKQPQMKAKDLIADGSARWKELFDLTLTLDQGNCTAKGDIVVDDVPLATNVPVTTLLFLEKQVSDIHAFVSKIPTPDQAETWAHNEQQDMLATPVRKTARTKKVQKPLVLYPATPEHPAQTQLATEDVIAGDWSQTLFTTRIPAQQKNEMLDRISKLADAIKVARERANSTEVEKKKMGEPILGYVFGSLAKK
jgi:hypothetical protein